MSGIFITLEGGEGAGKSTQARLLAERLAASGRPVLQTREPGGAPGAERLRRLLLDGDHGLSLRAEILVHFASRFDHIDRTIAPALAGGAFVICDRFTDSSLAYQGYGIGAGDPDTLAFIDQLIALTPLAPALTLLLRLDRAQARQRLDRRGDRPDRYERLDEAFHQRVADGFLQIARQAPDRVVVIDAAPESRIVHQDLFDALVAHLPQ